LSAALGRGIFSCRVTLSHSVRDGVSAPATCLSTWNQSRGRCRDWLPQMPERQRAQQAELLLIADSVSLRSVASTQPEAWRAERSGYDLALEWRPVYEEGEALETICQGGDAGQAEALKGVNVRDRTWQQPLPTDGLVGARAQAEHCGGRRALVEPSSAG